MATETTTSAGRVQTSEIIGTTCSVARVSKACRGQLNTAVNAAKADIRTVGEAKGGMKYNKLSADTRTMLESYNERTKVDKRPDLTKMTTEDLLAMVGRMAVKISQYADIAFTAAVDCVTQDVVRMAMETTKAAGKNNILPVHIVSDELKKSKCFAMIYNLPIVRDHAAYLKQLEADDAQRHAEKLAAKEQKKVDRAEEKKNEEKKPSNKKDKKDKKEDKSDENKKDKKDKKETKEAKVDDEHQADVAGRGYMYYVDRIIHNQKKELGDDYKGMRSSSYFREFCSAMIDQLITRMTSVFAILTQLGHMKTITDKIVITTLNIMLVDYSVEYPQLIASVNKCVMAYRTYQATKRDTKPTTDKAVKAPKVAKVAKVAK